GRFQDYKQLYRDRFRGTLVVPFFVRGRVAGTVTLASKTAAQYEHTEAESGKLAPVTTQLAQLFDEPSLNVQASPGAAAPSTPEAAAAGVPEPVIRRQERQAALNEVSSFLATEIREPMGYIRAQLEEVTGDGTLDFETQTSIEAAMRDLMRMESMLNDILDFAKPLQLDRRPCRVTALIEDGLALVATDLRVNRIEVTKEFPSRLGQVRWDREKIQHVFLSIFTNALEAMSPGGNLRISVSQKRGRQPEMVIRIHNDGAPIPEELIEKIFEPYFTTKRSGTGLGLAMVKKIVDEHEGHIAIDSRPQEGTLVTITLPAMRPRRPYRGKGRPPRRR
ncbi:MAG: GHKL domain-containing protein, partial [Nitrospira sp. SB0662_bin_26]|nr:GHKL domain-containing protein [Nitrospira sp. SB0662_bin_26]